MGWDDSQYVQTSDIQLDEELLMERSTKAIVPGPSDFGQALQHPKHKLHFTVPPQDEQECRHEEAMIWAQREIQKTHKGNKQNP